MIYLIAVLIFVSYIQKLHSYNFYPNIQIDRIQNENFYNCIKKIGQVINKNTDVITVVDINDTYRTLTNKNPAFQLNFLHEISYTTLQFRWYDWSWIGFYAKKSNTFIIIQENIYEIKKRLAYLHYAPIWNRKAFFGLFINEYMEEFNMNLFIKVLNEFYKIFNFMIIIKDKNIAGSITVITVNQVKICGTNCSIVTSSCDNEMLIKQLSGFSNENEIKEAFRPCPIYAMAPEDVNYVGTEFLQYINETIGLNFRIIRRPMEQYVYFLKKFRFNPHTITRYFYSINGWPTNLKYYLFDSIPEAYLFDSSIILTIPAPKLISPWKTVVHSLSGTFWIASISSFIVVSVIFWILNKQLRAFNECLIDVFSINITNALYTRRIPTGFPIRMLVICWILYSMHFIIVFSTGYFNSLVDPYYEKQISNTEDINKTNMKIYVKNELESFFKEDIIHLDTSYSFKSLDEIVTEFDPTSKCYMISDNELNLIEENNQKCYKIYIYPWKLLWHVFILEWCVKQIIFEAKIREMFLRLHAMGFGVLYERSDEIKVVTAGAYLSSKYCDKSNGMFSLQMKHVVVPLIVLLNGALISFTCLLCERWYRQVFICSKKFFKIVKIIIFFKKTKMQRKRH